MNGSRHWPAVSPSPPGSRRSTRKTRYAVFFHLLRSADWLLTVEIESWLVENYDITSRVITEAIERADPVMRHDHSITQSDLHDLLRRVADNMRRHE